MATLLLHATLFLLKFTAINGSHPAVSVHKHYLKRKRYSSQPTGHGFCLSIRQHIALVEGRIGEPEYLSDKIQRRDMAPNESIAKEYTVLFCDGAWSGNRKH
jgi:hypothetical protein